MNINELKQKLHNEGVPSDLYSLLIGGYPNEAYCLVRNSIDDWEVYYSERGQKSGERHFQIESEACDYLYRKLHKHARN